MDGIVRASLYSSVLYSTILIAFLEAYQKLNKANANTTR